ncbi:MAG TPA: ferritin-like domain-containing protein [Acetobacteraceae bacterium]|nr:ferritin-like domain-containing protein [Acetobacteraceae bacterium]
MNSATIEAADFAARHWDFHHQGPIRPGEDAHLDMLAELLIATYNPYKPAVIDWPKLEPDTLARITSLPIWDIAVQTEGKAGLRIDSYAATVKHPALRRALYHMGGEEKRHKEVLAHLVNAYGIKLQPEPEYKRPRDPEWAFMVTGYSECIDSFFAFGLFEMARRSGYFPKELVETFEPVIQEEGRHILFFINWVNWYRRSMPLWRRPYFAAKTAAVWAFLIWERIGLARDVSGGDNSQDANFTVNGAKALADEMDPAVLMDICLEENEKRMAGYDERLLRPNTMPRLTRFARLFIKPKKRKTG